MAIATKPSKNERLDLRVTSEAKRELEYAAQLSGESVSNFVLGASVRRASEVIKESQVLRLSNRDRDRFLAALDCQEPRNIPALRKAFARHRAATQ